MTPVSTAIDTQSLADLGHLLREAFVRILSAEHGHLPKPTELSRNWEIDQSLCIRVCAALKKDDPLSVIHGLPAASGLNALLSAALRVGTDSQLIEAGEMAVQTMNRVIAEVGGSKSNLDTLVGSRVYDARKKIERTGKQSIFRGMSNLFGIEVETSLVSYFVHPSDDPNWNNDLAVYGVQKLRRLRTELPILLGGRNSTRDDVDEIPAMLDSLHNGTIRSNGWATALKDFCSDPFPNIQISRNGNTLLYTLPDDERGAYEDLSLIFASLERHSSRSSRTENMTHAQHAFAPRNASKYMLLDVYVHPDVWPGIEPTLIIARAGPGHNPNRATFGFDKVDFVESLQNLGTTRSSTHFSEFPRYSELIGHVHEQMGWDQGTFRLYRCAVKYPVVGLWYSIQFALPPEITSLSNP